MSDKNNKTLKPGWRRVKFGEVVRLSKARSQDPMADGIERYVGLEHLEPGDLRIRSWGNVADGVTFTSVFQPGQVLFGKRRSYQRKVAVADFSGVCSGDIYVLETKDAQVLLPELLPFICQTDAFFDHAVGTSAGSLSPRTNWTSLADFEFALPPIDEQQEISFAIRSIEDVIEAYRSLEVAAIDLLRSSGDELLLNIGDAPKRPVRDLCEKHRPLCYGVVQPGDDLQSGVPLLRVCDLETSEPAIQSLKRITQSIDNQYKRSRVQAGDVLVSIVGTIGRVFLVPSPFNDFNIARAIARISPGPEVDSKYLFYVLSTTDYQQKLVNESVETARKTLNLEQLGKLLLPIPSLEVQRRIVHSLDELSVGLSVVRERLQHTIRLKSRVLDEIGGASV